jgi:pSer/pThr/pTyr-binding forkhead associated (FHA) protein
VAGRATLILGDGNELELHEEFTIGRADENDLTLDQPTVSRHHALVVEAEERWFLEDRGSFNGTVLNGIRVQPGVRLPLRHGDRIGFGAEHVVFSWPEGLSDVDRTTPIEQIAPLMSRPLSPFQGQVVRCLCAGWLQGGSLDDLPSNEEIAGKLGTPGATETVKAALRRAYAKAGLTEGSPYAKRRALCRVARQRGWI